jgi:PAT family beta-lactamase induction signal transducer AmpG
MLALGFSSGLPFMLIGNTLGAWLADEGVALAAIGFSSWIGLSYGVKFLWGAAVDRLPAPLANGLGRRRGWMLLAQIGVVLGLCAMAAGSPRTQLGWLVLAGVFTAFCSAVQDTVIDAWRIESAQDADELGLLTASYSLGYRAALIATEALIFSLAARVGWKASYGLFAALMAVGVFASLAAREPRLADEALTARTDALRRRPLSGINDAVVGPFVTFFRAHGVAAASFMLLLVGLFELCNFMRGPMINPFYKALGVSKDTIAQVRAGVGLIGSLVGIAAGGLSSQRLGNKATLMLGAILQPVGIAAFALLAAHGGDWSLASVGPLRVTAFAAIMTFDSFCGGFAGVALVSYMSTLTSLGYTATQYALLSSAGPLAGKTLKGLSGVLVEHLQQGRTALEGYGLFYLLCAAIGLPAAVLCLFLPRTRPNEFPPS